MRVGNESRWLAAIDHDFWQADINHCHRASYKQKRLTVVNWMHQPSLLESTKQCFLIGSFSLAYKSSLLASTKRLPIDSTARISAIAEVADRTVWCYLDYCCMLTTAIPDVEIYTVFAGLQYGFNLFARWNHRLWLKRWGVWVDRFGVDVTVVKSSS